MRASSRDYTTSGSGSAASSDGLAAATVGGASCTWYSGEECMRPRSCFDCLNTAVARGQCAIDPYGHCVGMEKYQPEQDFRVRGGAQPSTELYNFYPSTNATYCNVTDASCTACKQSAITQVGSLFGYGYISPLTPFCIGERGCVCVAACETIKWEMNVLLDLCDVRGIADQDANATKHKGSARAAMVLMVLALVGLGFLLTLVHKWWKRLKLSEIIKRRRAYFAELRLNLEGWNAMRQALIDAENAQLGVKPIVLDGHNADAGSDAEVEEEFEPASAVIVVEHGPGFRPVSPSEYERRRQQRQPQGGGAAAPA